MRVPTPLMKPYPAIDRRCSANLPAVHAEERAQATAAGEHRCGRPTVDDSPPTQVLNDRLE